MNIDLCDESRVISERKKIILDCDPGVDDALAILLALKSKRLDVQAITIVAGNETVEAATANAVYIATMVDDLYVPIYSGSSQPMTRTLASDHFFGMRGLGSITVQQIMHDELDDSSPVKQRKETLRKQIDRALSDNAVEQLLRIIANNPHEITLVATGPLTNIAHAIEKDAATMQLVKEIIIAGGAVAVPGNITPFAEFNMYIDPEAANIVLGADIKKVLISADVVTQTHYTWKELIEALPSQAWLYDAITRKKVATKDFLTHLLSFNNGSNVLETALFDPLAIFVATHSVATYPCALAVEEKDIVTRGKVHRGDQADSHTHIVRGVTKDHFEKFVIDTLVS